VGSKQSFREWLIDRVASTEFARARLSDAKLDELAEEMGIATDVLLAAQVRVLERRVKSGKPLSAGRKKAGSDHYQIELWIPEQIYQEWKYQCERRGLLGSALLRSMIHAYLKGSWEPRSVSRDWIWQGRKYDVKVKEWKDKYGSRCPFRERALITQGARRALVRRAELHNSQVSAVLRALVIYVLDGAWARPGTIEIIDKTGMWDDEQRYHLP
jgi:hypothetical protein